MLAQMAGQRNDLLDWLQVGLAALGPIAAVSIGLWALRHDRNMRDLTLLRESLVEAVAAANAVGHAAQDVAVRFAEYPLAELPERNDRAKTVRSAVARLDAAVVELDLVEPGEQLMTAATRAAEASKKVWIGADWPTAQVGDALNHRWDYEEARVEFVAVAKKTVQARQ